ncbi:hypothetical protein CMUS01_02802 [Colletotrichum musicola]|uniref:Protein DSF2 n=1 Tax=Colletotrichum musicola TaxID=2175873 RepID=A0A8H6U755_9PEZI|nr:hypothetical protein CMUS01_02802 [Colletotrichum musicola]
MGLRDILKKKNDLDNGDASSQAAVDRLAAPEFKFIRSDTHSQEVIHPPTGLHSSADGSDDQFLNPKDGSGQKPAPRRSLDVFFGNRSRSASASSQASTASNRKEAGGAGRRLSERLHLTRSPASSENVPQNLPEITTTTDGDGDESQWEKRATMLASANKSRPASRDNNDGGQQGWADAARRPSQAGSVSSPAIDEDIQEAIRLHEAGDYENSTVIFARLADPDGANNTLSQFLYGLSLRHGWGCQPDPEGAIKYLSAAASNAAAVEQMALKAGLKKGGAAKGELVLAIFELANSFRHGWGTAKDPIAAKQYYETAANLGDTGLAFPDAMNEVAWCYLEGFGCKKDKFAAARYYRLAEKNGNKTLGNSW